MVTMADWEGGNFSGECCAGRGALVTGGGSGIGLGIARYLNAHGAKVGIIGRSLSRLVSARSTFRYPAKVWPMACDVRDEEGLKAAMETAHKDMGPVHILVNAAAGNFLAPAHTLTKNGFSAVTQIDTLGTFLASKTWFNRFVLHDDQSDRKDELEGPELDKSGKMGPQKGKVGRNELEAAKSDKLGKMGPQGGKVGRNELEAAISDKLGKMAQQGGKVGRNELEGAKSDKLGKTDRVVINVTMTLHLSGTLFQSHAGAAKGGIDALTRHLAAEWGPLGVRVIGIAPGMTEGTEGQKKLATGLTGPPYESFIPLQRCGHIKEIAATALFLTLPEAQYITGTTLIVDGGQSLTVANYPLLDHAIRRAWAAGRLPSKL